jgi:hypothetical protein
MGGSLSECDDAECGVDKSAVHFGDGHGVGHGRGDLVEGVGEIVAVFDDVVADVDDDVIEAGFGDLPVVAVVAVADECFDLCVCGVSDLVADLVDECLPDAEHDVSARFGCRLLVRRVGRWCRGWPGGAGLRRRRLIG